MTKADKFNSDKKEIIKRLNSMLEAVYDAATLPELEELLILHNLVGVGMEKRKDNLAAKLAGAVIDYVHSR